MPFASQAQARMMFATKPAMAKEWAAKTPSIKSLPQHVAAKRLRREGLANERRHVAQANSRTPFNVPKGETGGGISLVPGAHGYKGGTQIGR